jgi:predicted ATPase/class 3 adenylate cyclase/DNA-binding CsgD family transcriptional regulator
MLFTDIEGSTQLLQRLRERYADVLEQHRAILRAAFDQHAGREVHTEGDSFFVVFSRAQDAVLAACAAQRSLAQHAWPSDVSLRLRMAVHTGEPRVINGDYVGMDVHRAARIGDAGHGGQVLLSRPTRDLVEHELPSGVRILDLGEHLLKDLERPEQIYQLVIDGLIQDFPHLRSRPLVSHNLPVQLTNFIGRERELASAYSMLADARLVTLTGPGGSGKTRFSLALAERALGLFPDGVYFVALAPITDPNLVMPSVAQALSVPDAAGRLAIDGIRDVLRDKRVLLILDNFEQVVEAAPQVADLLTTSPRLVVLATSRVALRISGEHELPVPPLQLPAAGARGDEDLASLAESDAVRLFVERSRAVRPEFTLTEENASSVAEICRRLDGLPLAVELAAARTRLLTPQSMLARIVGRGAMRASAVSARSASADDGPISGGRLQLLTGGAADLPDRQRTLRATIAWSYDLLDPAEQALFRRLSIFVGGFALEAAEAAADADVGNRRWAPVPGGAMDGVESLIAKSLIRPLDDTAAEPRFTMLETIREFGLERLTAEAETSSMQRWHAQYFLKFAERAEPLLHGPEQQDWLDRLEREHDNLRSALHWSLTTEREPETALAFAGALAWFWQSRAYIREGRGWLERALARRSRDSLPGCKALAGLAWITHTQRDADAARRAIDLAVPMSGGVGNRWWESWVLHVKGRIAYFDGDSITARELALESLAAARDAESPWLEAWAIHLLGLSAHISGDFDQALQYYEDALRIRTEIGFVEGVTICLLLMALAKYRQGRLREALADLRNGLEEVRGLVGFWSIGTGLAYAAAVAAALDQTERATRLLGAMQAMSNLTGAMPIPMADVLINETTDRIRANVTEAAYQQALAEGQRMTLDEAIAEALSVEYPPETVDSVDGTTTSAGAPGSGLTARELEVTRLLADGRTSREIAEELVVSAATVDRHLTHIYTKLGVRGRSEAIAWALRNGVS